MYILHASHTKFGYTHEFVEIFTSHELATQYVASHPEIESHEITFHEVNPQ